MARKLNVIFHGHNIDMHILFLSDNFPPETNAPATRLYEHAIHWIKAGHQITIITCAPNFPEGKLFAGYRNAWRQVEMLDGMRVVRMKTYITANEGFIKRSLDYLSFMLMGFVGGLFEKRPDLVVATSPQFFAAIGGWVLSVVKWRPFVFELRDLWPASIMAVGAMQKTFIIRILEHIEIFLYHRADAIIPVTHAFKKDLIDRGIDGNKIHVVINGVDLSRYVPQPRDTKIATEFNLQDKFVAGYMGTHGMAHALPKVLEAAELLLDEPQIVFFFAGSGAERSKVELIVAEKKLHNVRLIPRQPKERMPQLWSLCNISIVPLRNTPVFSTVIPSKIFESMAMGVPILMSLPEGEATDMIKSTGSGICVPPENPRAMADALLMLAKQKEVWLDLRESGLAAAPQFSRGQLAATMISIFESVVKKWNS